MKAASLLLPLLLACNNSKAHLPSLDQTPEETADLVKEAGTWINRPGQEKVTGVRIDCDKATGICSFAQVYDRESWIRVLYARCAVGKGCRYYGGQ